MGPDFREWAIWVPGEWHYSEGKPDAERSVGVWGTVAEKEGEGGAEPTCRRVDHGSSAEHP